MMLPGVILLFIFSIIPLIGSTIAFQNFMPGRGFFGSPWVGFAHFRMIFELQNTLRVIWNTVAISLMKMLVHFPVQIIFAIAINEVRNLKTKKIIQTSVYLPHFISWVILGEIISYMLAGDGILNHFLNLFGRESIFLLEMDNAFRYVLVFSDLWKGFGFGAIIYIATLSSINPMLYEACVIDGGNKWHQIRYITLPGLKPVITLVMLLSLGGIFNAGFDQVFNLYNPLVYHSGDILDTFMYRTGLLNMHYSFAAAMGLFRSLISFTLVAGTYILSYKIADYRII